MHMHQVGFSLHISSLAFLSPTLFRHIEFNHYGIHKSPCPVIRLTL